MRDERMWVREDAVRVVIKWGKKWGRRSRSSVLTPGIFRQNESPLNPKQHHSNNS